MTSEATAKATSDDSEGTVAARRPTDPNALDTGPTIVIEPKRGWLGIDFQELWHYRELLFFLVWRDLKARYKQTVIGAAWALIRPAVTILVFSAIFGRMAEMDSGKIPYPVFVCFSVLPWLLFQDTVSHAGVSLVNQASLLTKIYFPRLFIPASCAGISLVDFLLSVLVGLVTMGYYLYRGAIPAPGWSVLILPVLIGLILLAALGVGFVLAALTVTYRDFRSIIPFLMQIWMYASPVVWGAHLISLRNKCLMAVNPMFGIIDASRNVLVGRPIVWPPLLISAAMSVAVFFFGLYYFRRAERRFADIA